MSEKEDAKEEMDDLQQRANQYGWTEKMSSRYKELMIIVGEDPDDWHL